MKFVIARQDLGHLIRKIQNIVPQTPPLPILSHFLIEARDNELVFTATDLTIGICCSTPAKILEPGSLAVPAKRFFPLIRELTEPNVEIIAEEEGMIEINAGSSHFRLHGMNSSTFPTLPNLKEALSFSLKSDDLKEMLFRTSFAASKEDNRQVLTGVAMRVGGGKATFIGTDGKRLAQAQVDIHTASDFSGEYVLPAKAVDEMMKMLSEGEKVTAYLTHDKVAIVVGNTLFVTKLLSGDYPDCSQVLSSAVDFKVTLHREELSTLLRQMALFTTEETHSVRFSFHPGELFLMVNSANVGEGRVSMPVDYSGNVFEVAFNPHAFLDVLRHTKDETLTIGLSDPYNPGIITDSTSSVFILMPMRLNSEVGVT